jgi:hypothetical protein
MKNPTKKELHLQATLEQSVKVILSDKSTYKEVDKAVRYILKNQEHANPTMRMVANSVSSARAQFLQMQEKEIEFRNYERPESILKDKLRELNINLFLVKFFRTIFYAYLIITYVFAAVFLSRLVFLLELLRFDLISWYELLKGFSLTDWLTVYDWNFTNVFKEEITIQTYAQHFSPEEIEHLKMIQDSLGEIQTIGDEAVRNEAYENSTL